MSKTRTSKRTSPNTAVSTTIVARLSSELERASAALGSDSTGLPIVQLLHQLVERFRRELAAAITRDTAHEQQAVMTAPSSLPSLSTYVLERISGAVAKTLIVQQEAAEGASVEEHTYRVGCLELLDDHAWTWIDAEREGDFLRMYFPDDEFSGMPRFLDLEYPRQPKVGQNWRLLRGDRGLAAVFSVRSAEATAGELRHRWTHGDIVRSVYDGDIFVARFIRNVGDEDALVHWLTDDTYSEISRADILGTSTTKWSLELVPPDFDPWA